MKNLIKNDVILYSLITFVSAVVGMGAFFGFREYQAYEAKKQYELEKLAVNNPGGIRDQIESAYRGEIPPPETTHLFVNIDSVFGRANRPAIHYFRRQSNGIGVFEVVHDSSGLRSPRPRETMENADIMVVGGSQSWGQGLDYDETFAALVAEKFKLSLALAAVGGSGGLDSLGQILRHAKLRPKIIIYGFFDDHRFRNFTSRLQGRTVHGGLPPYLKAHGPSGPFSIEVSPDPGRANPFQAWSAANLPKSSTVNRKAVDSFFNGDFSGSTAYRPYHIDEKLVSTAINGMEFILTRMKEQADSLGSHLIVLYIPTAFLDAPLSSLHAPEQYARLAKKLGFSFVDITPDFLPYFEDNNRLAYDIVIPLDGHYNAWANRIMSRRIIEEMKRLGF